MEEFNIEPDFFFRDISENIKKYFNTAFDNAIFIIEDEMGFDLDEKALKVIINKSSRYKKLLQDINLSFIISKEKQIRNLADKTAKNNIEHIGIKLFDQDKKTQILIEEKEWVDFFRKQFSTKKGLQLSLFFFCLKRILEKRIDISLPTKSIKNIETQRKTLINEVKDSVAGTANASEMLIINFRVLIGVLFNSYVVEAYDKFKDDKKVITIIGNYKDIGQGRDEIGINIITIYLILKIYFYNDEKKLETWWRKLWRQNT